MEHIAEKYHLIGIGGIGMSALANILLEKKQDVSGSDLAATYVTRQLFDKGASVHMGHAAAHIQPGMTVIFSTDVLCDNPEVNEAKRLGCTILHRSELLKQLSIGLKMLAVTGTHGKTTTTALLATVLRAAKLDPSFAVGGILAGLETNGKYGLGEFFVSEADESDGTFLRYSPFGAIITNIDIDHMKYFQTEERLEREFLQFAEQVVEKKHLFYCGEDKRLKKLAVQGKSYGFNGTFDVQGKNFAQKGWQISFDVCFSGRSMKNVCVSALGRHNALNALAVIGLSLSLGIPEEAIREGLLHFSGVKRRMEKKGEVQGVLVFDDYAHHPREIEATLLGLREAALDRRLIAVYQPHRYSRMLETKGQYGKVFAAADAVFITDIYSAGEKKITGVTGKSIALEANAVFHPKEKLLEALQKFARPHDVFLFMGAGDITALSAAFVKRLEEQGVKKWEIAIGFGAESSEHEVSLRSGKFFADNLNPNFYEATLVFVDKKGRWYFGSQKPVAISVAAKKLKEFAAFLPVFHGPWGEDGALQGMFEILGVPYTGPNFRACAVCMDKRLTKMIARAEGVPTLPFVSAFKEESIEEIHQKVRETLFYPVFVKPCHLGSSIGVVKVESEGELLPALQEAFIWDTEVIIEQGKKIREIEFAVLGNERVETFPPGEILADGKVYDYNAKYGPEGFAVAARAPLQEDVMQEGMRLAKKAFRALGCTGFARVDFFLEENTWWLNEVNPIPGFTPISLYPQICVANGLPASEMLDRFIILALSRKRRLTKLQKDYN